LFEPLVTENLIFILFNSARVQLVPPLIVTVDGELFEPVTLVEEPFKVVPVVNWAVYDE